jgi:hypothetical protein
MAPPPTTLSLPSSTRGVAATEDPGRDLRGETGGGCRLNTAVHGVVRTAEPMAEKRAGPRRLPCSGDRLCCGDRRGDVLGRIFSCRGDFLSPCRCQSSRGISDILYCHWFGSFFV